MVHIYRQGDVILRELESPQNFSGATTKIVEMTGETGHKHSILGQVLEQGNRTLIQLDEPSQIVHEEHKPISIPKGQYEIYRVREFTEGGNRFGGD